MINGKFENVGKLLNSKLTEELGAAKKEIESLKKLLRELEVGNV
jgi:hypothetical protein